MSTAAALQPVKVEAAAADEVVTFVTRRLEQLLVDRGTPVELVRSVLKERGYDPALAAQSVKELAVRTTDTPIREHGSTGAGLRKSAWTRKFSNAPQTRSCTPAAR